MTNAFLTAAQSHDSSTFNGAVSHSTSGSKLLDYFAKSGSCRGREYNDVVADLSATFGEDQVNTLRAIFYNRMVTRKPTGFDSVQRGQGQRDEFVKSLKWLEQNEPELLYKNLWLVPVVGCWKDLWYHSPATQFSHFVNPSKVYELVRNGICDNTQRPLIAKYLPKIRSSVNTKTDRHRALNAWARGLCAFLGWNEKTYRKFKSAPENNAHLWQRLMSANAWDAIDFKSIPGKALFSLVGSKNEVLKKHGLEEKYLEWIKSQPVAKFTGYPYELYKAAKSDRTPIKRYTYNAQFEGLLALAKQNVNPALLDAGVMCCLDTSSSMTSCGFYSGKAMNYAPIDICVGLGIYFSSLITGTFKDHVIMFDSSSRMLKLNGTFCDKVDQLSREATAWGGTNFQSVIDEILRIRAACPSIPVEDYPRVLLVVSDMSFDATGTPETNYEAAMRRLRAAGLPDMTFIWWNVNSAEKSVPNKMDDKGIVLVSGFDGSIVSRILEAENESVVTDAGEKIKATPYEVMMLCLDQEVLRLITV